jgi:polysaccharide biosynthesis/export protein
MQTISRHNYTDRSQIPRDETNTTRGLLSRPGANKPTCCFPRQQLGIIGGLAALVLLLLTSCQDPKGETLPASVSGEKPGILAAGDVVRVSFTGAPELNQSQKIGSDGKVSLPMVGDVYAAGKSLRQFQDELTGLYKTQLQSNEVIVTLETVAIPVVVSGEVQKPGKIVFERPATVLEAIMEAGGFTDYADPKRVSVVRLIHGVHHTQIFDLSPVLRGMPTHATYVRAGDVIYVRQKLFVF